MEDVLEKIPYMGIDDLEKMYRRVEKVLLEDPLSANKGVVKILYEIECKVMEKYGLK